MGPIDKLRRALGDTASLEEAVARRRVADFIADYRSLCEEVGPWRYAADLGAPPDATLRQIAYLAVWHDGPKLRVWGDVKDFDAIGFVVDAALEGFDTHVASETAEA